MTRALVVDDDRTVLLMVRRALADLGVEVETASTAKEGLAAAAERGFDLVLLDVLLPDLSGLEAFERLHALDSRLPVIFVTASGSSDTAIEAMQLGAYDFVMKPLDLPKLKALAQRAIDSRRMMNVPVAIPSVSENQTGGDHLVGRSESMLSVYRAIGRVAGQDVTVLINGESGTGKELVARAIYQHSRRSQGRFLAVNCAALPDSLLESELFGHEKGAFTGADSRRIGKFEQCSGGTIFLDEIGDMAPLVQSKVLRLLQEQRFERVGGNETIETDVRIISATNRDLEAMVQRGKFRPDLFYRLNGFTINLPPLRERGKDVELLLEHFMSTFRQELGKEEVEGVAPEAVELLMQYDWPGNVREMQTVVKQFLLNATGPVVVPAFLPEEVLNPDAERTVGGDAGTNLSLFVNGRLATNSENVYAETLEMMERYLITRVLEQTEGNQSQASRILGITRGSLRTKIRALGISIDQVVRVEDDREDDES